MTYERNPNDVMGITLDRIITQLKKDGIEYSLQDLINAVQSDDRAEQTVKDS